MLRNGAGPVGGDMTPFASLPMYNFPEMRTANAQFWGALRGLLLEAGLSDVPETLLSERAPVPPRLEAEMLFSQTCGYPLETVFKGQAPRLGAPVYDVPGCAGATHRAFFVVRADFPARRLDDLRGAVFLLNSSLSNSGMNLPRRALAEIAGREAGVPQVIETGGHPASLEGLLRGEGDVASIDCVTYAFWRHTSRRRRCGYVSSVRRRRARRSLSSPRSQPRGRSSQSCATRSAASRQIPAMNSTRAVSAPEFFQA